MADFIPPDGGEAELPPGAEPLEAPPPQLPISVDPNAGLPAGAEPLDEAPVWEPLDIANGEMPPGVYTAKEKRQVTAAGLRSLYNEGKFLKKDQAAAAIEISQALKIDPAIVLDNIDSWKQHLADPNFDAQELIDNDPVLADEIDKNPLIAPSVTMTREPSLWAKLAASWQYSNQDPSVAVSAAMMEGSTMEQAGSQPMAKYAEELKTFDALSPKPVSAQLIDKSKDGLGAMAVAEHVIANAKLSEEYQAAGFTAFMMDATGGDPTSALFNAQRIGNKIQPTYFGEEHGFVEGTTEALYPLASFYAAGGMKAIPAAAVAGGTALILTRGRLAPAIKIGKFAGGVAMDAAMFEKAATDAIGRNYLTLTTLTTPDGNEIDRETKLGMAALLGLAEAAVVTYGTSYLTGRLGALTEAAVSGEARRVAALFASREFTAMAKRVGTQLAKDAPKTTVVGYGQGYLTNLFEQVVTLGAQGIVDRPYVEGGVEGGPGVWTYLDKIDWTKPMETGFQMAATNLAIHAGTSVVVPTLIEGARFGHSMYNAEVAHRVTGIARSELGKTMPTVAKNLLIGQFKASGRKPITEFYWTAKEFIETFGDQAEEVANTVLGPEGDVKLAEAVGGANNSRLAIPLDKFMQAARDRPQIVDQMVLHTTVDPRADTMAQTLEKLPAVLAEANRMAAEYKNNPDNVVEKRLLVFRGQIEKTFTDLKIAFTPEDIDSIVDLQRAAVMKATLDSKGSYTPEDLVDMMVPTVFTPKKGHIEQIIRRANEHRKSQEKLALSSEVPLLDIAFRNKETGEVINIGPGFHDLAKLSDALGHDYGQAADFITDDAAIAKWEPGFAKSGTKEFLTRTEADAVKSGETKAMTPQERVIIAAPDTKLGVLRSVNNALMKAMGIERPAKGLDVTGVGGWAQPLLDKNRRYKGSNIALTPGANKPMLIHELGHTYIWTIHQMVKDGKATTRVAQDYADIISWLQEKHPVSPEALWGHHIGRHAEAVSGPIAGHSGEITSVIKDNNPEGVLLLIKDPTTGQAKWARPSELNRTVVSMGSTLKIPVNPKQVADEAFGAGIWKWEWDEQFAVAFETYISTGKAPSPGLSGAFARFRNWYMTVYGMFGLNNLSYGPHKDISGVSPEMRAIFDRMLATDAQMKRMAIWRKERKIFNTPEEAGITDPLEWQKYVEDAAGWFDRTIHEADRAAVMDAIMETQKAFKDRVTEITERELRTYKADPYQQAWYALKFGEFYDDKGNLVDTIPGAIKFTRKSVEGQFGKGFDTILEQFITDKPGEGMAIDDFAAVHGFSSSYTILTAIHDGMKNEPTIEARLQRAKDTALSVARRENKSLLEDAERMSEVIGDAMHNPKDKEWLKRELDLLKGKFVKGGKDPNAPDPIESIKLAAKQIFEKMMWKDLDVNKLLHMERRAADQALEASAVGKYEDAYLYKKQQLLYSHLYDMVKSARGEVGGYNELMKKQMLKERRQILGHGAPEIQEIIDQLAEAVGIRTPDQTANQDRANVKDVVDIILGEKLEPAFDPDTVQNLIKNPKPVDEYTVQELRDAIAAVKQLWTVGKKKFKIYVKGREESYQDLLARILSEESGTPNKEQYPKKTHGFWKSVWDAQQWTASIFASMTDPELIFERLGPSSTEFFWDRYIQSRNRETALAEKVLDPLLKSWRDLPKELKDIQFKKVDTDSIPWDRRTERDRTWMWMLMLNWGNAGNRKRVMDGYGWSEGQIYQFFEDNNVTKAEWDFVQNIWDIYNTTLWPEVQKAYESVNGVKPRAVEAVPIPTPHGSYRGGYFPIKYERIQESRAKDFMGKVLGGEIDGLRELYDEVAAALSMSAGFTQNRSKVARPRTVELDWSVVPSHTANVIHYISFDEAIRDMQVMIKNPDFQTIVNNRLGQKYMPQLNAWLYVLATGKNSSPNEALSGWHKLLRWGRGGLVINTLGYNVGVAMGDMVTPLTAVTVGKEAGGVDARYLSGSMVRAFGDMAKGSAQKLGVGPEFESMRRRGLKYSQELGPRNSKLRHKLNEELRAIGGEARHLPAKALAAVREHAWFFMEWSDLLSSTIVWDAAFEQHIAGQREAAQAKGENFVVNYAEAARDADRRVRALMPSHVIAEQPSMLRDRHSIGALMAFYSYFNKLYNMGRRVWHDPYQTWHEDAGPEGDNPGFGTAAWNKAAKGYKLSKSVAMASGRTVATLAVANVLGELLSGRGKEEDEKWGQWLLRKSLASPTLLVPIAGTVGEEWINQKVTGKHRQLSVRTAPAAAAIEALAIAVNTQKSSQKTKYEKLWKWLEASGPIAHIPAKQVSKTGSYIQRVAQNRVRPRGPFDMAGGLFYGQKENKPKNPLVLLQDATSKRKQ